MSKKNKTDSEEHWPAVKAFIVDNNNLLIIKRSNYTVQKPGMWEIPGGRLEKKDEDPIEGLKREVKEETNLDIEIIKPLNIQYFTRADNQKIMLTIFLCTPITKSIKLSKEHTDFEWIDIKKAKEKLGHFHEEVNIYLNKVNQQ
jgi:8-oxo-dGTP diphosphatase